MLSRLVLPFWYRPTRVVLDKGPLNGCVCVCVIYVFIDGLIDTTWSCVERLAVISLTHKEVTERTYVYAVIDLGML